LKALELEPYSIEESERAAGQGNFIQAKRRRLETQEGNTVAEPQLVESDEEIEDSE
jgi:bud site selection protein 20